MQTYQFHPYVHFIDNLSRNYVLKYNCLCLILERGSHEQNIDVQIGNSQYIHIYLYDSDIRTFCNLNSKGDEYHYTLICPSFRKERELYLKKILLYDTKHTQIYQSLLIYE